MTNHEAYLLIGLMACVFSFVGLLLLVVFHFTTVRRLSRNPATCARLGLRLGFGAEALNVAMAMCQRRNLLDGLAGNPAVGFVADLQRIQRHTSRRERCFGRVCFAEFVVGCTLVAALMAVHRWGLVEGAMVAAGTLGLWCFVVLGGPCFLAAQVDARRSKRHDTPCPERPTAGRPRKALRARSRRHGVRSRRMTPPPRRSAAR